MPGPAPGTGRESGAPSNRPRTEDRQRRYHINESIEKDEHDLLRQCLGHDDLPKESHFSNLAHIQNFTTVDPIRDHKPGIHQHQKMTEVQDPDTN